MNPWSDLNGFYHFEIGRQNVTIVTHMCVCTTNPRRGPNVRSVCTIVTHLCVCTINPRRGTNVRSVCTIVTYPCVCTRLFTVKLFYTQHTFSSYLLTYKISFSTLLLFQTFFFQKNQYIATFGLTKIQTAFSHLHIFLKKFFFSFLFLWYFPFPGRCCCSCWQ